MTTAELLREGLTSLLKPPFRTIWLLLMLISAASASMSADAEDATLAIVSTVLFTVLGMLLEMTAVLAAASGEPAGADASIRRALKQRSFLRFAGASVFSDLTVAAGTLLLVVGGFVMGALVALAPQAAALERRLPMEALARSVFVTRTARITIGLVYGLFVLVPTLASVGLYFSGARSVTAQLIIGMTSSTLGLAGSIALTRAFVTLRTAEVPEPELPGPTEV